MTDEQLAEIRARCEAATPGPWVWDEDRINDKFYRIRGVRNPKRFYPKYNDSLRSQWVFLLRRRFEGDDACLNDDDSYGNIMALRWSSVKGNSLYSLGLVNDDAAFIAHARTDVPDLLAEVERLRGLLSDGAAPPAQPQVKTDR